MTNYIEHEEDTSEHEEDNQLEKGEKEVVDPELAELNMIEEIFRIQRHLLRLQFLEGLGNSSSESKQGGEEKFEVDTSSVVVLESEDDYEEPTYKSRLKAGKKLKA